MTKYSLLSRALINLVLNFQVFYDIEVIEPLRKVASSPDSVASRLASQALQLIGEEVPHKLSQQVPLWTVEDVAHWVSEV